MKRFVSNTGNETLQMFSRDWNESKIRTWMKRTLSFFNVFVQLTRTARSFLAVSDLTMSSFTFTIYCSPLARDRGNSSVAQRDTDPFIANTLMCISSLTCRYVRVDFPAKFSWLGETVGGCCHSDCGKQWWQQRWAGEHLPYSLEQGWQCSWWSKKWKSTQ